MNYVDVRILKCFDYSGINGLINAPSVHRIKFVIGKKKQVPHFKDLHNIGIDFHMIDRRITFSDILPILVANGILKIN